MDEQERRAAALVAAATTAAAIFDANPEQVADLADRFATYIETGDLGAAGEPTRPAKTPRKPEGLPIPKTLAENASMKERLHTHAAERRARKDADKLAEARALSAAGEGGSEGGG